VFPGQVTDAVGDCAGTLREAEGSKRLNVAGIALSVLLWALMGSERLEYQRAPVALTWSLTLTLKRGPNHNHNYNPKP